MAEGTLQPHEKANWRRAKAQFSFSPCPEQGLAEWILTVVWPLNMCFTFSYTSPLFDTGTYTGLINTRCFLDDSDKLKKKELKVKHKTLKSFV